jgi:hypothetical protein
LIENFSRGESFHLLNIPTELSPTIDCIGVQHMKKLLSLAFLAIALTGLSGCKSHDGCDDGMFPSFGDMPKLGLLKHGKHGGCGCDAAPCSTCNTTAPCSSCQGGYAAGYSGGVLEGNVIEGGVSTGPGCNCGGGSNGMLLPSTSTGTPTITTSPMGGNVMPGVGGP